MIASRFRSPLSPGPRVSDTLRARCEQLQINVEVASTRVRLGRERQRLRHEMSQAARTARDEQAWLRHEAGAMLAQGWTLDELREIGFSEALLRPLSFSPLP